MDLEYKKNFTAAQKQWGHFWKGERKTPLIGAVLPKPGVEPKLRPVYMSGYDGRYEAIADGILTWADSHLFLGAAIPYYFASFSADHCAALLGADLEFDFKAETSWSIPFAKDWDDTEIRFRPDCIWWERTVTFLRALRRRCDGRVYIATPTMAAGLDALSAIRGPQNLMTDLALVPEKVKRVQADLCKAYAQIMQALFEELGAFDRGSITRHGMYSPGRTDVLQCDASCMISPDMFQTFGLPYIQSDAACLDDAVYHLDGPDAIKHLESVCSVDKISVIQWVAGAGEAAAKDWTGLYERVAGLSKGLILHGDSARINRLTERLPSNRLYFSLKADSETEALRYLEKTDNIY